MLAMSVRRIARVILKAREINAGLGDGRGTSTSERELRGYIADLNEDEQASLVAVMWIGRDTFLPEELEEAMATAKAEATIPTEDYLLGVPLLADYLEDGLEKLGHSVNDIEDELL